MERTASADAYLQPLDHFVRGDLVCDLLHPRRVSDLPVGAHDATEGSGRLGLRGEVHPGGQLFFHSPLPASIGQKTKVQRERGDFVTSFCISKISNLERALSRQRPGTQRCLSTRWVSGSWDPTRRPPPPPTPSQSPRGLPGPSRRCRGRHRAAPEFPIPPFTMKSTSEHQHPKFGGFGWPARSPRPPLGQREAASLHPAGEEDARPRGLGLGRKTRDPGGPARSGGAVNKTPLPALPGPRLSPPRSGHPRAAPHPAGGDPSRPRPQPRARKRLTRLRTSHFVPLTSARGPWWLLAPPRRRAPPRPEQHFQGGPRQA